MADTPDPLSLETLKRRFQEARDMTSDARRESEIDGDYENGFQWTPAERRALALRKQPDLVFNRVRPAIYGMLGVLRNGRTDPRAFGRNPDDDDAADVATKVLRFIADRARFSDTRLDVAKNYLVEGTGVAIIEGTEDGKVPVKQIRWEEFFYDPRSRRRDFKDALYLGIAKWVYADWLTRTFGEDAGDVFAAMDAFSGTGMDPTFRDRPTTQAGLWYDRKLQRVMLVEMYYNDGGTWQRILFYADKVLEQGVSPYKDEAGEPCCPIEAISCFIDRENQRYGVVRDMRGPQDEINKRRSKALHILNNRQVFAESEIALDTDAETVRKEAAQPDGVLPPGWKLVPQTDVLASHIELLNEAKSEIERQSPNPAILGRLGNEESGRAQLVRQQAGMTELAVVLGGIEDWELRVYRQMWARAKQFWTAPDYVRVTDDVGAPEYIGINQPQQGQPMVGMHPETGMPMIYRPVLGYKNALAELDVDITLDVTPHVANVEQEQFMALVELRRAGVPIDPMLLIQASSLPGKGKLIEAMQQQAQQPDPQQQLALAEQQANVQDKQASAAHKAAQAQHVGAMAQQTQVETAIAAQQPHNAMFQAGINAGMQQAQFQNDRALAKQEIVAKQLAQLGEWEHRNADREAAKVTQRAAS